MHIGHLIIEERIERVGDIGILETLSDSFGRESVDGIPFRVALGCEWLCVEIEAAEGVYLAVCFDRE